MQIVSITLREVGVVSFSPKTHLLKLRVRYVVEKEHALEMEVTSEDCQEIVELLIAAVRKEVMKRMLHSRGTLGDVLSIVIIDEDRVEKRLNAFLQEVQKEIELFRIQKVASGYLQRIARITNMKKGM